MSGATIAASLPGLERHFADQPNAGLLSRLVLTVPAIFIAICAPLAGGIVDRFGRRNLLLFAVALFGLAGMSGLVLDSLPGLLVGRALLGISVGCTMTTATALIGDYFHGSERERFMGWQAAFIGVGGVIFLTGGGFVAELHWRAPFAVYGLAFLLVPAVLAFIQEPPKSAHEGFVSPDAPGMRNVWLVISALYAASVLNMIVFYMIPTQLPFYLQSMGITAPSRIGEAIGFGQTIGVIVSLNYAHIRRMLGLLGTFGLGFGSIAVGYILLGEAETFAAVLVAMAIGGISMGSMMPGLVSGAMALAPPVMRGRVAGGMTASIFAGQFLSPFVSQPLVQSVGYHSLYTYVGIFVAALSIGSTVAGIYLGIRARTNGQLAQPEARTE
jgi:MFS family permease